MDADGRAVDGAEGNMRRHRLPQEQAERLAIDGWYTKAEEMEGVSVARRCGFSRKTMLLLVLPLGLVRGASFGPVFACKSPRESAVP